MHEIIFFTNSRGKQPVLDYLEELSRKTDKSSRIKYSKILDYIEVLSEYGFSAGEPYLKHLDGSIWELRPLRDRVLFVAWADNSFVLLHHFMKQTQKTPLREIAKAKKEYEYLLGRSLTDE